MTVPDTITDPIMCAEWEHFAGYGWSDSLPSPRARRRDAA